MIESRPGVYAAGQRSAGPTDSAIGAGKFEVMASVPANWRREGPFNPVSTMLQQYPDLIGIHAENGGRALGVVRAVKAAGKAERGAVFGTDDIANPHAATRPGDLTGTLDSFPVLTGELATEVALRLMAGQDLPHMLAPPQVQITKDHMDP